MTTQKSETLADNSQDGSILICKEHSNEIRWKEGERLDHLYEQMCDQLEADGKPDHPAAIFEGQTVSFKELDDKANQTARYLLSKGLKAGDKIGLLFDKSVETYVALLAVLKINAAYVPFDGSFPNDRISFIIEDAGVKTILSLAIFEEKTNATGLPVVFLDRSASEINTFAEGRLTDEEKGAPADDIAYLIYTSGTTGKPKGVVIEHPSICNFVRVAAEIYGYGPTDRVYQGMTIAFDFSVEELWVPLLAGAALVPGKPGANLVGADLADYLFDNKVTGLACVPTLLATIERDLPDLRLLIVSGEACPQNLVNRWSKPGRTILNAYGPTEATVTCTLTELLPDKEVTIGGPLPTYTIVILDPEKNELLGAGEMGEIAIAGIGLAQGYLGLPKLTSEKFIEDFIGLPFNPSKRIYRSGDLGRINDNDEVEFHGRIDTQVKVRGYRIELTEIESVLMEFPEIAQAVVDTYEAEPGSVELAAYYSLNEGYDEIPHPKLGEVLKARLPRYMIPAYMEVLPVIPMTPSHKADRKALPDPKGTRFAPGSGEIVAAQNEKQEYLVKELAAVLQVEEVSIEDNFFSDLGAHSLLMARFCSAIRKNPECASASMRDIYLNPTIAKLSENLHPVSTVGSYQTIDKPPHIASDLEYYGCGALQALFYVGYGALILYIGLMGLSWTLSAGGVLDLYLRSMGFAVSAMAFFIFLPIIVKWTLIGRWKAQEIPIWSMSYFRFWVVKTLIRSNPILLYKELPVYNIYLRLLGAKIGANAVIRTKNVPVCTDLISIGENTILRQDSSATGYKAQSGYIHTGPVTVGNNVTVGEAAFLDINTSMEDGSELGHTSSLHAGQTAEARKSYHGCPAIETSSRYKFDDERSCSSARKLYYSAVSIFSGFFSVGTLLFLALLTLFYSYLGPVGDLQSAAAKLPPLTFTVTLILAIITLAFFVSGLFWQLVKMIALPRILALFLREDETYVLYGFQYYLANLIKSLSNSTFFNILFGDSSFIVHYLELIGYKLGKFVQTGSNFGTEQKHDNPLLCELGSGTMVSSGLTMVNTHMSATSFRQSKAEIGQENFLGNVILYPRGGVTGANCLLATKVMVPIDGPIKENTGLLGSPAFEIPRAVDRDINFQGDQPSVNKEEQLTRKNASNIRSMISMVLAYWFLGFSGLVFGYYGINLFAKYGFLALLGVGTVFSLFTVGYLIFLAQVSLKFSKLKPRDCLILDDYFWGVEHHWKLSDTFVKFLFTGTPFRNVVTRLMGVDMGRKVFDDGAIPTERSLVRIGHNCTLGEDVILQSHSLEEGVFKSDMIEIGNGVTISPNAFVHYGVKLEDGSSIAPDSFLMKGETVSAESTWQGNPAKEI